MKLLGTLALLSSLCTPLALPQGRPLDWVSAGNDARRSGWERSDTRITRDNADKIQFLYKRKLVNKDTGPYGLTPPVVVGLLISYRGFKELGFVANDAGEMWAIDLDLNRVFWTRKLAGPKASGACAGYAAMPALTPPVQFGGRRPGAAATPAANPAKPPRVGRVGFGVAVPVFALAGDGKVHQLNTADGSDQYPPLDLVPSGAKAAALTLQGGQMVTTTGGNCGGPNGVYALGMNDDEPKAVSFPLNGGEAAGLSGFALAGDGTVFVQTGAGKHHPDGNQFAHSLLALSGGDLKLKGYYTVDGPKGPGHLNAATPALFEHNGKELVVMAGADGRLHLLDAANAGGADHKTALAQSAPLAGEGGGVWGGISTWEDADKTRWVAAPVWGPVGKDLNPAVTNGATPNGAVVAFKVEDKGGKLQFTPGWVSRDLASPVPPVVTSGVVFALSTGGYTATGTQMKAKGGKAALYALDGKTGKELFGSGAQVTAPASLTGMTLANGRVFFTTTDGTLYSFGIYMEI